jgi:hypothetical protein
MRRRLSEAEFLRLALKEAEVPIIAAGRRPHPSFFPSSSEASPVQDESRDRHDVAIRRPVKKRTVAHTP